MCVDLLRADPDAGCEFNAYIAELSERVGEPARAHAAYCAVRDSVGFAGEVNGSEAPTRGNLELGVPEGTLGDRIERTQEGNVQPVTPRSSLISGGSATKLGGTGRKTPD